MFLLESGWVGEGSGEAVEEAVEDGGWRWGLERGLVGAGRRAAVGGEW